MEPDDNITNQAKKLAKNNKDVNNNTDSSFSGIMLDLSFESDGNESDSRVPSEVNHRIHIPSITQPIKTKKYYDWQTKTMFENFEEAFNYLKDEDFSCYEVAEPKSGQKFYFRCTKVPKASKAWCAKRYCIHLPSTEMNYILLDNGLEHSHDQVMEGKRRPISREMKKFIYDLFNNNVTYLPTVINMINHTRTEQNLFIDEPNPNKDQKAYLLKKFRSKDVKPIIKIGDMMSWCQENADYPQQSDETFVLHHVCSKTTDDNTFFRFSLSTPNLFEEISRN